MINVRIMEDGIQRDPPGALLGQRFTRVRTVAAKMNPAAGMGGPTPAPGTARPRVGGGPTVEGRTITLRSFYDAAPEISKSVPILFGSAHFCDIICGHADTLENTC